jgi:hypothetical protein
MTLETATLDQWSCSPVPDSSGADSFNDKFIVSIARRNTRSDALHFNLLNKNVEKISGVAVEEDKRYLLSVRMEAIGAFDVRHIQRKNIAIVVEVPRRFADKVRVGFPYKLKIDAVIEQPRLRAVQSRDGVSLRISWTDVGQFGLYPGTREAQSQRIIEFQLQNVSQLAVPTRSYFTSHQAKPSFQFLVGKYGAKEGDSFKLVNVRSFNVADFVDDFNFHRSVGMQNFRLDILQDKLLMVVNGQTLMFQEWHLTAIGAKAILSARPKDTHREIRFCLDGDKTEARFDKYCRINWVKATIYGIEISYFPNNRRECRFRRSLGKFDGSIITQGVILISKTANKGEPLTFAVSPSAQEYIWFRLGSTEKYRGYMFEKGRISEEIQRHLISLTGEWDEVAAHPARYGPDSLQRSTISKALYYFELKWVQSKLVAHTLAEASLQVVRDYHDNPWHQKELIAGAYVGLLDWDGGGFGYFHMEKVWPNSEGYTTRSSKREPSSLQPAK